MINTSITKTALWKSLNFEEKYGTWNSLYNFTSANSTTFTVSNNIYNIHVKQGLSGWATAFTVSRGQIYVPYGYTYRIAIDVYFPTAHEMPCDTNNYSWESSSWTGNDHDEIAKRYPFASTSSNVCKFSIPATTWTTLIWGASNTDQTNAETRYSLDVSDAIGVITTGDSSSGLDWQMKNPRFIVYKDSNIFSSIGKDGTTHANQIYEI